MWEQIQPNDGIILESCIHLLLKKYFRATPDLYIQLIELFEKIKLTTELGQMLDVTQTEQSGDLRIDPSQFTLPIYQRIVKYKTSYYTFYLPVACALVLSNLIDESIFREAEQICLQFGEYFQIQDDYLDCYGDIQTTGKIGTDIQDKKCSWLAVQFILKASPSQIAIFQEYYGRNEEAAVLRIKQLYEEIQMKKLFEEYENSSLERLTDQISKISNEGLRSVLTTFLHFLFKRSK